MTSSVLRDLETAVEAFLAKESIVTPATIRTWIGNFRPMFAVTDVESEALARQLEARHDVTMRIGSVLTERDFKPWLEASSAGIEWYYWNRYRRLLSEEMHFSQQVITTIHSETDRTLGLLQDPEEGGSWARRGMVVGHVQSGKTANYIGLVAKAADAGYRVIIVIAGVHNNLRNQTQKRVDEGFVGRDSARLLAKNRVERFIGVGKFDATRRPVTFTNSVKDFNKEMATGLGLPLPSITEPAVFVIKKNYSTLKNLSEWMGEHNSSKAARDLPMLLIDDEADNASINVQYGAGEVSRINGQIRNLLQHFSRSCYVGYTATPFANIFIDPDSAAEMLGADLFPRHFIVSLDPPSNYFGAERVFGHDSASVVRHIADNEDVLPLKHLKDFAVSALPPSLMKAVRTFVVARAIRILRGDGTEHCSMLVNASRFTGMQGRIRALIQELLVDIQASVRLHGALPTERALRDSEMSALFTVWTDEYPNAGVEWPEVQRVLVEASAAIRVVEVNSRSHGTLNYSDYKESGLSVIAVGGYSLSRGLTLEGLMVSYFLRNSVMYDTLMQMGRWFGYRPNYDDLCRVWMPEEAEGWYAHVAESIEMLREELRAMAAAGATPEQFGLKVRAHPDTLIVTARNKMGAGERVVVSIGLATRFAETASLRRDAISLNANRENIRQFAASLREHHVEVSGEARVRGGWLLRNVPVAPVLGFISTFANSSLSMLTDPGPVSKYIQGRKETELAVWDVLLAGTAGTEPTIEDKTFGITISCQRRTAGDRSDTKTLRVTNKQRVASRGIEKTGLTQEQIADAEASYRKTNSPSPSGDWNYPDWIYRAKRQRPLLVIHLLNMLKDGKPLYAEPVVAWSIGFPDTRLPEERVEYVVTRTWLSENMPAELEADDMEGDDD
jgi:hypothetical protein